MFWWWRTQILIGGLVGIHRDTESREGLGGCSVVEKLRKLIYMPKRGETYFFEIDENLVLL